MALQNYRPGKAAFMFIFVTVALDMVALGVMIPVLPKLIVSFSGGDFGSASRMVGYFGIAWAFMQFMFQPILGAMSDRYGRRPVVLLSNVGLGLDYIVMALAPSLAWLFLGRIISGAAAASFSTASAYIADITPPEKRAGRYGMLGGAFGLGFVIGPALAFLGRGGFQPAQRALWLFRAAGIAGAGKSHQELRLAHRPCDRLDPLPVARPDFDLHRYRGVPVLSGA